MNRDKQIQELSDAFYFADDMCNNDRWSCNEIAEFVINQGYCKQSAATWMSNTEKFSNIYDHFYCSNCKNYTDERNPYRLGNYCSFCGAKMVKGE